MNYRGLPTWAPTSVGEGVLVRIARFSGASAFLPGRRHDIRDTRPVTNPV